MSDTKKNIAETALQLGITLAQNAKDKLKHPIISVSERLKKGFADIVELRQGLKLIINDYQPRKTVEVTFHVDSPPLEFAYCLSGEAVATVITESGTEEKIEFMEGMNTVFYFPASKGKIKLYPDNPIRIVSLHISPEFLKNFLEGNYDGLPDKFVQILEGSQQEFFIQNNDNTPSMKVAALQLFDATKKTGLKKMFAESKALELMSLQITQLIESDTAENNLSDKELAAAKKVKQILDKEFREPPSLSDLANAAQISHTKLNFAFRKLFDSTVFEYIRKKRLDYSVQLLHEGKLSITEIAYEAGWSNPSHFSKEFIKIFAVSPKKYQKDIRK